MVFTLTREDASKMLGVSTRTVDRYIHAGKIRTKRDGKVIMLHKEDVTQVKGGGEQKDYEIIAPKPVLAPSIGYDPREAQNEILRTLETIIREKDALIQELTYKLGSMEAEMHNTVPRLEHKKALIALEEAQTSRLHDMDILVQTKNTLENKYKREKLISTILMIGVFVLLCASIVLAFHFFSLRGVVPNTL
jgi:excisionase family DNA binding protein